MSRDRVQSQLQKIKDRAETMIARNKFYYQIDFHTICGSAVMAALLMSFSLS